MNKKFYVFLFLAITNLFIACAETLTDSESPIFSDLKILTKVRFGTMQYLYSVNFEGQDVKLLVEHKGDIRQVRWSPEGNKILFSSTKFDNRSIPNVFDIYVINADGTEERNLTNTISQSEWFPEWSPDGRRIVFFRWETDGTKIFIIDTNGENVQNITQRELVSDSFPRWSPDGSKISFLRRNDTGASDVWIMNSDGTNQQKLTNHPESDFEQEWSPDGTKIAFISKRDAHAENLFVMESDGTNLVQLTENTVLNANFTWSPEGSKIVYAVSERLGPLNYVLDIFVIDIFSKKAVQLTESGDEFRPSWSPDGNKIAFYSGREGRSRMFLMNSDGSGQFRLIPELNDTVLRKISWGRQRIK